MHEFIPLSAYVECAAKALEGQGSIPTVGAIKACLLLKHNMQAAASSIQYELSRRRGTKPKTRRAVASR